MYSRRVQNRIADMEAQEQERLIQEFRNATINQAQNQVGEIPFIYFWKISFNSIIKSKVNSVNYG